MASLPLSVRLSSGMQIEIDPSEWPEIGDAEWTAQREGGMINAHLVARRHSDGRTLIYMDANPGEGPLIQGDLLPAGAAEVEEAIGRFGELHALPNWVMARLVQSIRG